MKTSCSFLGGLTVDICPSRILCLKFTSKSLILFISLCSRLLNLHFKALFLAPRRKRDFGLEPSILFSWLSQPNFFYLAHGSQLNWHTTVWRAAWPGSSCCSEKQKLWFELWAEWMGWENKVPQVRFRQGLSVSRDSDCPLSTVRKVTFVKYKAGALSLTSLLPNLFLSWASHMIYKDLHSNCPQESVSFA